MEQKERLYTDLSLGEAKLILEEGVHSCRCHCGSWQGWLSGAGVSVDSAPLQACARDWASGEWLYSILC